MNKRLAKWISMLGAASTIFIVSGPAAASGFAIVEQSVSGLGNAFAGGAAIAQDGSTIFFNPAGMSRLENGSFVGALHYIKPSTEFTDKGSRQIIPPATIIPLSGNDGGDAGVAAVVPNLYYVQQLGEKLTFGLGINSPFGLSTEYDDNWQGRYHGIESSVTTININPSIAYKVSETISVGGGISAQFIEGKLTSAIDYPKVCLGLEADGTLPVGTCGAIGLTTPQSNDGTVEVEGDDWSFGANVGLLWAISPETRLGLAYRSKMGHSLAGDADFINAPAAFTGLTGIFVDSGISLDVDLPETFSVSLYSDVNPKLAVMGDITWTKWSNLDEIRVQYDNIAQPDSVETFNWDDTLRYSLGLSYKISNTLLFRTGLAFDQAPVPSAKDRGVRIPDADRKWITFGLGYKPANGVDIDVGYAHIAVDDAEINNTNITGHNLVGTFEASVDILSVQASWKF